ncbi:MAG: hypothetical protein J6M60_03640 [Clostridia bacterium]|nr:hypothetical protein [Clostridia bacterium]
MSDKVVKINNTEIEHDYFEYLKPISKDDGLVDFPSKEDIERNKVKFRDFFSKYKFLDEFLVNSELGNVIVKTSIYPSRINEYIKRVNSISFSLNKKMKQHSIFEYFVKDNFDIMDYDRFALGILDIAILEETGKYSDLLRTKEIIKDISSYFKSQGKENYINFSIDTLNSSEDKACLKIYNYKRLIGLPFDKGMPINLDNDEINKIVSLCYPTDMAAIMKYFECGVHIYDLMVDNLDKMDNFQMQVINELMTSTLTNKSMFPYIDNSRFYKLALYRLLNFMENNNYFVDKNYSEEDNFKSFIGIIDKLYNEVEKMKDVDKEELPIISYNGSKEASVYFCTANDLIIKYNKVLPNFLSTLMGQDENYVYYLLRSDDLTITEECFISLIDKVKNKEDLIYIGYAKLGVLSKERLLDLIALLDIKEIGELTNKLVINNDPNLQYFIDNKLITGLDYRILYDNGTISVKDIRKILEKTDESFKNKGLNFSGVKLAELYKTIYGADIVKILINKEKISEEELKRVIRENPALAITVKNKKELSSLIKEFRFQKDMFKEFATDDDLSQFVEVLGEDLGLSSYIALDLFNKGIITEEQAKSMDGIYFKKFIESKKEGKYLKTLSSKDVISNKNKLLNLISHKRISPSDIIIYYSKGIIPEDLYRELDKSDFKGKVDSKYLTSLAEKLKISGRYTDYGEIERYIAECNKYADTDDFFKGYDEKIINSKKIDNLQLVELGRRGLLSKTALSKILERGDIGVIVKLIKGENTIDLDTTRTLFLDLCESENTHTKRDLLEAVLRQGKFSNDEIFSILLSTYRGMDDESEKQKELNNENLQYFFNKGLIEIDVNEESIKKKVNRSERKNNSIEKGFSSDIDSQRRFPLFERFDCLFTLDKNSIFNKKGPALVFEMKRYGKTVIETLGTIKDEVLQNDLTNHRTFIMDTDLYEKYKNEFTSTLNGEEIIQFKRLIEWFDDNKDVLNMSECKHTKNWKENIKKKIGVNTDKTDNKDINLIIENYSNILN